MNYRQWISEVEGKSVNDPICTTPESGSGQHPRDEALADHPVRHPENLDQQVLSQYRALWVELRNSNRPMGMYHTARLTPFGTSTQQSQCHQDSEQQETVSDDVARTTNSRESSSPTLYDWDEYFTDIETRFTDDEPDDEYEPDGNPPTDLIF